MASILSAIHLYPVKSCRAVAVDTAEVTGTGLRGDRQFQVVDADGNPVTQRQQPVLATVQPTMIEGGLRLEAPGRSVLEVATPAANDTTANSLFGVAVDAGDAGDAAATWFTELLGSPVRLVAMTEQSDYKVPLTGIELTTSWADAAPTLVVNAASLRWLNERADAPFGMDRFRPNLTVEAGEPWVEDTWREFSIGAARFGLGLPWPRCAIPQVDQVDGSRHKEPARVLKRYRWCTDAASAPEGLRPFLVGSGVFGIGCSVRPIGATVALGDELTVHETGDRLLPPPV